MLCNTILSKLKVKEVPTFTSTNTTIRPVANHYIYIFKYIYI